MLVTLKITINDHTFADIIATQPQAYAMINALAAAIHRADSHFRPQDRVRIKVIGQ